MPDNITETAENTDFPKIIQVPPHTRVDPRQIMRILGPDAFRLTPATLAVRMSHGKWQAARHLQYLSTTLATELNKGNARLIISMPPRHGKPLSIEELVLTANGTYKRLGDICIGDKVITHTGLPQVVTAVFEQGVLPVLEIVTRKGRYITTAYDHPFMTNKGWQEAQHLKVGDRLAVRHTAAVIPTQEVSAEEARLIGYFLGDGCCVYANIDSETSVPTLMSRLICHDPEELEDIYTVVNRMGFQIRHVDEGRYDLRGGIRDWLRKVGIAGMNSHTKRVPEKLFKASKASIANFIGAYFACDGTVSGHKHQMTVNPLFVSCNRELLQDIQRLLLRVGIDSRLTSRWHLGGYNKDKGGSAEYRLEINRRDDVERFAAIIPIFGIKAQRLKDKMCAIYGKKRPQVKLFAEGIFDDEIIAIEDQGETECRCLEVANDHTFTVQDVIVHNSKLGSVRTPIWLYDRNPSHQIGICSYGADLATGFSEEVRDIIEEDNDDQDGEHLLRVKLKTSKVNNWSTTEGGRMYAVGVGGTLYGRGVHDLLVDDYYKNPEEASSQAYRDKVYDWFSVIAATRIEPGGSIIIIATRWDPDDLSGRLLSMPNSPWREIRIPGIAEEDDPLGREVGEALWPERYDIDALESWRATMGGYYFDAIVQQKPRKSRSSLFKENWLKIIQERPRGSQWIALRIWDAAATEDGGDYTVGLLLMVNILTKQIVIADVIRVQMSPGKVEELIKMTAEADGKDVSIVFAQEPGSSGKSIVYQYTKMLVGYRAEGVKETGSKFVRAQPLFGACEHGDVYLVKGNWNRPFIDECVSFPDGDHDDQVDAASLGFNKIFNPKKRAGAFGRNDRGSLIVPQASALRKETFDELTTLTGGIILPDTSLVVPTKRKVSLVWGRR